MKLLSPEVSFEHTRETDIQDLQTGNWVISANNVAGTTSSTIYFRGADPVFIFRTAKPWRVHTITVSNYDPVKAHWFSVGSDFNFSAMSPPLTEEELSDIHRGLEEIRTGKAKSFNNVRETIEWLHRRRT
jgi:hypothetical protein